MVILFYSLYGLPILAALLFVVSVIRDGYLVQPQAKPVATTRAFRRCMRLAAARGYNPYDSHTTQAHCYRLQAARRG